MTELESRVLEHLDADELVRSLRELVRIPSLTGEERPAQEWMASRMADYGLEVDRWEIDLHSLERHPAYATEVERQRTDELGVVGTYGGGEGKTLVLNGHIDVVPAGAPQLWSFDPWGAEVADGRIYGRGSVDMKGGLISGLHAIRTIIRAGVALRGRVLLQSVIGEEDGGMGTLAAVLRRHVGDGAIVLEPSSLALIPIHAGSLNFRLTVQGRAAHGAIRWRGVSAIEKFSLLHATLLELERERNARPADPLFATHEIPFGISIGTIHGGEWASTVPETVVAEGRYGIIPGETLAEARSEFEERIAAVAAGDPWLRDHPPVLEWYGGIFAPASTPLDAPVVQVMHGAVAEVTGRPPAYGSMTAGTDMRLLVNEGSTPAVIFGPGDLYLAHAVNEYVPIDEVIDATRTLVLAILRFCSAG